MRLKVYRLAILCGILGCGLMSIGCGDDEPMLPTQPNTDTQTISPGQTVTVIICPNCKIGQLPSPSPSPSPEP